MHADLTEAAHWSVVEVNEGVRERERIARKVRETAKTTGHNDDTAPELKRAVTWW